MSLIDDFLPDYQFSERHQTMARCGPGELLDIVQSFKPPQDRVKDVLMFIRQIPAMLLPTTWRPSEFHRQRPSRRQISFRLVGMETGKSWVDSWGNFGVRTFDWSSWVVFPSSLILMLLARPSWLLDFVQSKLATPRVSQQRLVYIARIDTPL
jgi:hypothetical protein